MLVSAAEVLRGVTLQINPREHVGLVGRNGAGKTTIFRLLTRQEETDSGEVILLKGLRIGLLDQQPSFQGTLSVRDEAGSVFTALRAMEQELTRLEHLMSETSGEALDELHQPVFEHSLGGVTIDIQPGDYHLRDVADGYIYLGFGTQLK